MPQLFYLRKAPIACVLSYLSILLAGCGGGGGGDPASPVQTFTVGGTLTGLSGTVVLQDNGAGTLSVMANGAFTFAAAVAAGGHYAVTVLTQPNGQTCTVGSGTGTVSANVSGVLVSCTTNQYTIGGTASGLVRPVVLKNNLGDNLTVSADGAFVFAGTVAAGGVYSVSVLTPPPGEACTVEGGAGTASGNVTSVSVSCSADAGAFFVPFKATGQILAPGGTYIGPWPPPTNGTNGLMAVASDAISASPVFITKELTDTVGITQHLTLGSDGSVGAGAPSTLVYATKGARGGDHLWAVDLSGGSSLVPRQVSNVTGSFIGTLSCGYFEGFKNLNDPDSAFFILAFPSDSVNVCQGGSASINTVLVRLSDSASTTPLHSPVGPDHLVALYDPSGALAGIVTLDASQHLVFYADETFTNPKVLLNNVFNFSDFRAPEVSSMVQVSSRPGSAMIVVYAPDLSQTLYRVDYTGTVSPTLYTFQGSWGSLIQDANSFFFEDVVSSYTSPSLRIVQVPLDGSAAGQILYSELESSPTVPLPYLVGSSGGQLVAIREPQLDSTSGAVTVPGVVQTWAVGVPGAPQTIVSVSAVFSAQLVGNFIYILSGKEGTDPSYGPLDSTEILALDGTVLQPVLPASSFPYSYGGLVLQVKGITDPGGDGGGGLYVLDPSSPTGASAVEVRLLDGSGYTLPSRSLAPSLEPVAANVAIGIAGYATQNIGVVYDRSRNVIVPISLPSTDVVMVQTPF